MNQICLNCLDAIGNNEFYILDSNNNQVVPTLPTQNQSNYYHKTCLISIVLAKTKKFVDNLKVSSTETIIKSLFVDESFKLSPFERYLLKENYKNISSLKSESKIKELKEQMDKKNALEQIFDKMNPWDKDDIKNYFVKISENTNYFDNLKEILINNDEIIKKDKDDFIEQEDNIEKIIFEPKDMGKLD